MHTAFFLLWYHVLKDICTAVFGWFELHEIAIDLCCSKKEFQQEEEATVRVANILSSTIQMEKLRESAPGELPAGCA